PLWVCAGFRSPLRGKLMIRVLIVRRAMSATCGLFAAVLAIALLAWPSVAGEKVSAQPLEEYGPEAPLCEQVSWLCTDWVVPESLRTEYVGHDEPAVAFYSNVPGSGNSNLYTLTLPKDPPTLPRQDGSGGTFNFQLLPAFWFGMALCDNQSYPEFTHAPCTPNSDSNIFDGADPAAPDYIGKHPGTAFLELQFYPPGWNGVIPCD